MFAIVTMAQSVSVDASSPEAIIAQIGLPAFILTMLITVVIASLVIGLLLKFVGGSVLGYPVKYGSAFLAVFIATLVSSALEFVLMMAKIVEPSTSMDGGLMAQVMRHGPIVFAASQFAGFIVMTWAIRTFLKGPSDEQPSWGNSLMISLAMAVIGTIFAVLILQIAPNQGMAG
jgi:hypothetical protein